MIETVIKSTGSKEPYDVAHVENAVKSAARDAGIEDEADPAVSAVVAAVTSNAGERTEVETREIREWALETLDEVNPTIAAAWRKYDSNRGR